MTDDAAKKRRELEHELTLTMTAQVSYMERELWCFRQSIKCTSDAYTRLLCVTCSKSLSLGKTFSDSKFNSYHKRFILVFYPHLQIELDKTAEEFRKAHSERQELLRQWENTIEQMQKRDREMDQLAVVSTLESPVQRK